MKTFRVHYKVPVGGVYPLTDSYCHVRAISREDAEDQVGKLIEDHYDTMDKVGLVFTSIHEESHTWLHELMVQYGDLTELRSSLRSAALGGYRAKVYEGKHIYYVPWLKPLIVRGVGSDAYSAYEILKEGVDSLMDVADFETLNRWNQQYEDWCRGQG